MVIIANSDPGNHRACLNQVFIIKKIIEHMHDKVPNTTNETASK